MFVDIYQFTLSYVKYTFKRLIKKFSKLRFRNSKFDLGRFCY